MPRQPTHSLPLWNMDDLIARGVTRECERVMSQFEALAAGIERNDAV